MKIKYDIEKNNYYLTDLSRFGISRRISHVLIQKEITAYMGDFKF